MNLEELFKQSDVIISTIERSKDTVELLKKKEYIDSMKKDSLVVGINGSRETLDEKYIIEKVKKGDLSGYIFEGKVEGLNPQDFEGYNIKNYSLAAWYTKSSLATNAELYSDQINKILAGDTTASVEKNLERSAL